MPTIDADGCPIHVVVEGRADAPALILSNSLGTNLHMWDDQAPAFARDFRLIRYDRRGHGQSGCPSGPYSMERLGRDVLAILDALDVGKANWCGLSMGGMVGMWLGANAPQRFDKLVLSNTSAYYADKAMWDARLKFARENGVAAVVDSTVERWFTKEFRARSPQAVERIAGMLRNTELEGYLGCAAAVRDMDHRELLPKISVPTLVIAGRYDPATTPEMAEYIHGRIPGAKLVMLDAAHISNVEQAQAYTQTVLDFLKR